MHAGVTPNFHGSSARHFVLADTIPFLPMLTGIASPSVSLPCYWQTEMLFLSR